MIFEGTMGHTGPPINPNRPTVGRKIVYHVRTAKNSAVNRKKDDLTKLFHFELLACTGIFTVDFPVFNRERIIGFKSPKKNDHEIVYAFLEISISSHYGTFYFSFRAVNVFCGTDKIDPESHLFIVPFRSI